MPSAPSCSHVRPASVIRAVPRSISSVSRPRTRPSSELACRSRTFARRSGSTCGRRVRASRSPSASAARPFPRSRSTCITRNAARPSTLARRSGSLARLGQRLLAEPHRVGGLAVVVADDRPEAQRLGSGRPGWRRGDRRLEDRVGLDDLRDVDEEALGGEHRPPDRLVAEGLGVSSLARSYSDAASSVAPRSRLAAAAASSAAATFSWRPSVAPPRWRARASSDVAVRASVAWARRSSSGSASEMTAWARSGWLKRIAWRSTAAMPPGAPARAPRARRDPPGGACRASARPRRPRAGAPRAWRAARRRSAPRRGLRASPGSAGARPGSRRLPVRARSRAISRA